MSSSTSVVGLELVKQSIAKNEVGPLPGVFPRLELDDFVTEPVRINLFLLAYRALQQDTDFAKSQHSYFNICGIHFLPPIPWAGVQQNALSDALRKAGREDQFKGKGDASVGYCIHGSLLFMPWHRPYEVLMEQTVIAKMFEIAQTFKSDVKIAGLYSASAIKNMEFARQFRMPYWEPLRPRAGKYANATTSTIPNPAGGNQTVNLVGTLTFGLPAILRTKFVRVTNPDGTTEIIKNPLYDYELPQKGTGPGALGNPTTGIEKIQTGSADKFFQGMYSTYRRDRNNAAEPEYTHTVRNPDVATGQTNHTVLEKNLSNSADARREKIYQSLTRTGGSWAKMACTFTDQMAFRKHDPNSSGVAKDGLSIEAYHDDMHQIIGGSLTESFGVKLDRTARGHLFSNNGAAFDPIFFIMHSNIERLMCLWQCLNPDNWWKTAAKGGVEDKVAEEDMRDGLPTRLFTYVEGIGTYERPDTPLMPFRRKPPASKGMFARWFAPDPYDPASEFWTTQDIEDWTQFGYQYPGIEREPQSVYDEHPAKTKDALKTKATIHINKLYGWYSSQTEDDLKVDPSKTLPQEMRVRNYEWADGSSKQFPVFVTDPQIIDDAIADPPVDPLKVHTMMTPRALPNKRVIHARVGPATEEKTSTPKLALQQRVLVEPRKTVEELPPSQSEAFKKHVAAWTAPTHLMETGSLRIWNFQFVVERFALMGSFAIYVFIGDFPANPALWAQEPHLVYSAGVLTGGAAEAANHPNGAADDCENCRRQRESRQRYRDFVPLTKMLVDYQRSGEVQPPAPATDGMSLRSLDPDDVVPFLKRNLHWRVIGPNGEVPREQTAGLHVCVSSTLMKVPADVTQLPEYDEDQFHVDITDGRPSGLSHSDG